MNTCCFIGHRKVDLSESDLECLTALIEKVIEDGISTFLFGSKSKFDDLCLGIVTELKQKKYPHIMRIYVRAEYEYISGEYLLYLLESYDKTYFSDYARNSGRLSYIKRNHEMIDKSDVCIFYCVNDYTPPKKTYRRTSNTSGTHLALAYAQSKNKQIVNLADIIL